MIFCIEKELIELYYSELIPNPGRRNLGFRMLKVIFDTAVRFKNVIGSSQVCDHPEKNNTL